MAAEQQTSADKCSGVKFATLSSIQTLVVFLSFFFKLLVTNPVTFTVVIGHFGDDRQVLLSTFSLNTIRVLIFTSVAQTSHLVLGTIIEF